MYRAWSKGFVSKYIALLMDVVYCTITIYNLNFLMFQKRNIRKVVGKWKTKSSLDITSRMWLTPVYPEKKHHTLGKPKYEVLINYYMYETRCLQISCTCTRLFSSKIKTFFPVCKIHTLALHICIVYLQSTYVPDYACYMDW